MQTLITHGVKISVESFYQPAHSEPHRKRYLHVYNIRIENKNSFPVKLLTRHWYIVESTGSIKEVEGDGVIGKQPMLDPGDFHQYSSYSILSSEHGKMYGTYHMERLDTGEKFDVEIPGFILIIPAKLN
jgi:ApaG protein